MAFTKTALASPDQEANWLLSGTAWDVFGSGRGLPNGVITYSFPDNSSDYGKGGSNGFQAFTDPQKTAFHSIFDSLEALTRGVDFVEVKYNGTLGDVEGSYAPFSTTDGSAMLRYAKTSKLGPDSSYTYLPTEKDTGGDSWFGNATKVFDGSIKLGTYAYTVLQHEMGHGLGLEHSFDNGPYGTVPTVLDSLEYTVMSYSSYSGAKDWYNGANDFPQTYMVLDIASLQSMYGADFTYHSGNTRYEWSPTSGSLTTYENGSSTGIVELQPSANKVFETIWDGGGRDTYDFHLYSTPLSIDLRPGQWTQTDTLNNFQTADLGARDSIAGPHYAVGNIANAPLYAPPADAAGSSTSPNLASLVENAIGGTGNDAFTVNQVVNTFTGNGGNDTFVWASLADVANTAFRPGGTLESTADTIADFSSGDRIDLHAVQPTSVWTSSVGTEHYLYGAVDGHASADFAVHVQGSFDVTSSVNWANHAQWLIA